MNATDADRSAADPAVDHVEQNPLIELAATYLSGHRSSQRPEHVALHHELSAEERTEIVKPHKTSGVHS
jgi:hypothetical protein